MSGGRISRIKGGLVRLFRRLVLRDPFLLEVKRWFRDRGDETLRLDYPLGPSSRVLDLGGYQGDFAAAIHERYGCQVFVFEPMPAFYRRCVERFAGVDGVRCFNFGLAGQDGAFELVDAGDASSFVRDDEGGRRIQAELRSISDVWREQELGDVDLVKINIEGGEYDVIPALVESGLISRVRFLQVQFHDFIVDGKSKREAIRQHLRLTHDEMWNYEFVWESWRLR